MEESFEPTEGMKEEAERAIKWKEEGRQGGTRIGLVRARQIIRGENLSRDTVMRMYSFFSRHEKNKKAEGFYPDEEGYPSPSRVAWGLWGGDAGYTWSSAIRDRIVKEEQERGFKMEQIERMQILTRNAELEGEGYDKQNSIWNVIVSTPEVDRYGTIIEPSGIDYSAYMNNPVVLAQHGADKFPVGKCLTLGLVGGNLEATIEIECITEVGKELNALIAAGFVNAVSVGILPKATEEKTIGEDKVMAYTKSELVEFSVVSVPANRGALIKRDFKKLIQDSIQKYKEEKRMLTPEIEQKIVDELLPAVEEAILAELTNMGFSQDEAKSAVESMLEVGVDALFNNLRGGDAVPPDHVVEPEAEDTAVETVTEGMEVDVEITKTDDEEIDAEDEMEDEEEGSTEEPVEASFEAEQVRVGKKIAAKTEANLVEGLSMIKQGYKIINSIRGQVNKSANSIDSKKSSRQVSKRSVEQRANITLNIPVEKSTEELLKLI